MAGRLGNGNGGGPTFRSSHGDDDSHIHQRMDALAGRISAIETEMKSVKDVLGRMELLLVRIDERVKDMPTAEGFGELKGRVGQLPTVVHLCALVLSIFGLAFVLLRYGLPAH